MKFICAKDYLEKSSKVYRAWGFLSIALDVIGENSGEKQWPKICLLRIRSSISQSRYLCYWH
jgi:hypothetical protein